ncbi:unnamed protein product [Urochloa humidicola]
MMRRRGSGESDDQVMANAHAVYKQESEGNKPFTLDYWWRAVKDEQKWAKRKENQVTATNKRLKNTASGAYTSSSNQESQEATSPSKEPRPEGHKQAKARLKGKEKRHSSDMTLESLKTEKMKLYHEATQVKAAAVAKAAEATERKANVDLLNKYLEMTAVDTTGFSDVQLQRHEIALNFLQRKLSDEK